MSPIASLAYALVNALRDDLPQIQHFDVDYSQPADASGRRPTRSLWSRPQEHEVDVYMFPQAWSDTTLGFGGIGGQAITKAYTIVVMCDNSAAVYFGGRLAYTIPTVNRRFMQDLRDQNMAPKYQSGQYRIADPVEEGPLHAKKEPAGQGQARQSIGTDSRAEQIPVPNRAEPETPVDG